jgi:hypothetical protein
VPSVTITDDKGKTVNFSVTDKSDAIRQLSSRLLTTASRTSVAKVLNEWLTTSMKKDLKLHIRSETVIIKYAD